MGRLLLDFDTIVALGRESLLSVTFPRMFSICEKVVLALQSALFSMRARSMRVHLVRGSCVVRAAEEPEDYGERLRDLATRKPFCIMAIRMIQASFNVSWIDGKTRFKGWGWITDMHGTEKGILHGINILG